MVLCDGSQEHQQLISGRALATERYPPKLIKTILKGLRNSLVTPGVIGTLEVGPTVEGQEIVVQPEHLRLVESEKPMDE